MTIPPGYSTDQAAQPPGLPCCVRHPNRRTGLRCSRCDRPACPQCLREASVGYQCVDCVNSGRRTIRRPVTIAGAELSTKPVVVPVLILVNVVIYVITAVQAGSVGQNADAPLFMDWALWPPIVAGGQEWRLITSGFLHFGPIHLVVNMLALYLIGRDLEPVLGRLRFAAVYLLSLLGGSIAVFLFGDNRAQVAGASGAVFGLMGAMLVAFLRLRLNPSGAIGMIALNVVFTLTFPGISIQGHLGGLVVGTLTMVGMVYPPAKRRNLWQVVTVVGLLVLMVLLFLYQDGQYQDLTCDTARCVSG